MPADTPDYMAGAWASCMIWASGQPEMLRAFREATGNRWQPGASALEREIDRATGAEAAFMEAFTRWANEHVWGLAGAMEGDEPDGP